MLPFDTRAMGLHGFDKASGMFWVIGYVTVLGTSLGYFVPRELNTLSRYAS